MATGYEVDMYNNIKTIAQEMKNQTDILGSIAASLRALTSVVDGDGAGVVRVDPHYDQ